MEIAERRTALARMLEAFTVAHDRMLEVHGLRLPKHLAYAAGWWQGLSDAERAYANRLLGRVSLRCRGVAVRWPLRSSAAARARADGCPRDGERVRQPRRSPGALVRRSRAAAAHDRVRGPRRHLAGEPGWALVIGRELHSLDDAKQRAIGTELLVAAYRALGREALAVIAARS